MIIAMTMRRPMRAAINVPRQLRMRRTEDSDLFIAVGVQAGKIRSCPFGLATKIRGAPNFPQEMFHVRDWFTCNAVTRVQLCPVRHTPSREVLAERKFGIRIQSNSGAVPHFFQPFY